MESYPLDAHARAAERRMSMSNELKPCPFCGGEAKKHVNNQLNGIEAIWYIQCQNSDCRARMHKHISGYDPKQKELLSEFCEQWNRRVTDGQA